MSVQSKLVSFTNRNGTINNTVTSNCVGTSLIMMWLRSLPILQNELSVPSWITSPTCIGYGRAPPQLQDRRRICCGCRHITNGSTATCRCTITSRDPRMIWLTFARMRGISLILNFLLILIYTFLRKNDGDYATCQIR